MATEYSEETELVQAIDSIIDEKVYGLEILKKNDVSLLGCFSVKTNKEGETTACKTNPVSLKKVPDCMRLFIRDAAHFVIVVDYQSWAEWDEQTRRAKLFHVLYSIVPEVTESGLKLKKRKPDITAYIPEAKLFGPYSPEMTDYYDALTEAAKKTSRIIAGDPEDPENPEDPPHIKTADEESIPELKPTPPKRRAKQQDV